MTEAYFDLADVHLLSEGTANRADGGPDPDYVTAFPFAATDAIRNKMSMFTYNATATQWKGMIDAAAEKGFSKFYVHHKLTTGFVTLPPWFEDMVDYIAAMNGGGEVQGQGQGLELGQGTTAAASPTGTVLPLPQTFHLTPNGSTASSPPLLNPNRGFRMQIDNACLPGKAGQDALEQGLATCKTYNLTVTLMYCYLTRFWNVSLLPSAFLHTDLPQRFASLREAGVTAILNFGYMDGKANFSQDVEPFSFEPIRGHIAQMAPVIRAHADMVRTYIMVIMSVYLKVVCGVVSSRACPLYLPRTQVHSVQAGFLGNAGEWAHDIHNLTSNHTGKRGSRPFHGLVCRKAVVPLSGHPYIHVLTRLVHTYFNMYRTGGHGRPAFIRRPGYAARGPLRAHSQKPRKDGVVT